MADWHFFEGVRGEWRWYRVDAAGKVVDEAADAFADVQACMADARAAGFSDHEFAVHARSVLPKFPRPRRKAAHVALDRREAPPARPLTTAKR